MAAVVYLDADDEITSAASRIRVADDKRIALVVPYGSRLATSRINFRLLAREAQARGHRLSVVAGDAATRALAASAGLPVFGSVGEYEEAETTRPPAAEQGSAPAGARTESPGRRRRPTAGGNGAGDAARATAAGLGAGVVAAGATTAAPPSTGTAGERGASPAADLGATQPIAVETRPASRAGRGAPAAGSAATAGAAAVTGAGAAAGARTLPWAGRGFTWRYGQTGAIILAALLGLGLLALAVGAFILLPSARAVVSVQLERIGPLPMEIRADPEATAPDAASATIPAQRLTFDVATSGTFPATGRRVEQSRARGQVTFLSKNPVDVNRIGIGAIVSTPNGIQFRTTERVVIPTATLVGLTVVPGEATASIEAVEPGPQGNVGAQAITVVPSNEDPTFTEVRNPSATSGGSRQEFPRVEQADVDAAVAQLEGQLQEEFAAILADPGRVPPGLTLFGESRQLADPLPTTDPATLVGQEVAEFELGLATTGTVIAVDPKPVESVVAQRIARSVDSDYRLVDGSVVVTPGEPEVTGDAVTFPVSATASRIRVVDAASLREEIKGKPLDEARAILDQYGEVELSAWPEWVSAIPTIDARLEVRVELPEGVAAPEPSGSAAPSGSGGPSPDGSPPDAPASSGSAAPSGSAGASGSEVSPAGSGSPASVAPGLEGESPPP